MDNVGHEELIEMMSRFDDVRVLVVGDVMVDEYLWGHVARISPEAPVPVVEVRRYSWAAGGAANVALNLRALGASVDLAGVVGDDPAAATLLDELNKQGVGTAGLVTDPARPTTHKIRVMAQHQQVTRIDREDRAPLAEPVASKLLDAAGEALPNADAVVIEDYGKGVVTAAVSAHLIRQARELGKPVIVDPKERRFRMYRGATLITPNLREAADATDVEERNDDETVEWIARRLKETLACDMVLITRGEKGMSLVSSDGSFCTIPTAAREVFDVSGAGDTVVAAIAAGLGAGGRIEAACGVANHAASCVIAKLGTATATRDEIRATLDAEPK